MKSIRDHTLTVEQARASLGDHVDAAWLRFAVRHLAYTEVDVDGDAIRYPGYVPLADLLTELQASITRGEVVTRRCQECAECFDLDKTEGIFGDYDNLEGFICAPCAGKLSAWDFWQRHFRA